MQHSIDPYDIAQKALEGLQQDKVGNLKRELYYVLELWMYDYGLYPPPPNAFLKRLINKGLWNNMPTEKTLPASEYIKNKQFIDPEFKLVPWQCHEDAWKPDELILQIIDDYEPLKKFVNKNTRSNTIALGILMSLEQPYEIKPECSLSVTELLINTANPGFVKKVTLRNNGDKRTAENTPDVYNANKLASKHLEKNIPSHKIAGLIAEEMGKHPKTIRKYLAKHPSGEWNKKRTER